VGPPSTCALDRGDLFYEFDEEHRSDYTLDGTTPTLSSPQYLGSAITIGSTETLKADAFAPGFARSAVRSAIYTIH